MVRRAERLLLTGMVVLGGVGLSGCGGGSGAVAPTGAGSEAFQTAQSTGAVKLQLDLAAASRQGTTPAAIEVVLSGPGMANAAMQTVILPATTATFAGVPEGKKWALATGWDDTDIAHANPPIALGFTGLEVLPGQTQNAELLVTSPVGFPAEHVAGTVDLLGKQVSVVSQGGQDGSPEALLLSQSNEGTLLHGWIESVPVAPLGGRQASTGQHASVPFLFVQPVAILPEGAGVGYRKETETGVWVDKTGEVLSTFMTAGRQTTPPVIGHVTALVEYLDTHGVIVPAGKFPNASLVSLRLRGGSDPNAPLDFSVDVEMETHYVAGMGPVLTRQRDNEIGLQGTAVPNERLRVLLGTSIGSQLRSPAVPYPLGNLLYPLDSDRVWSYGEVPLVGATGTTPAV